MSDAVSSAPADTGATDVSSTEAEASPEIGGEATGLSADQVGTDAEKNPGQEKPPVEKKEPAEDKDFVSAKQIKAAAYKKFEEAATLRKEAEGLKTQIQQLFANPEKLFELPGIAEKLREAAIKRLTQEMEFETLSPEQRKLKEYEQRIQQWEAQQAEATKAQEQTKAQQEQQAALENLRPFFKKTLEGLGLSNVPVAVKRAAVITRTLAQENGGQLPDPSDVADLVKEEITSEHREMYAPMSGAQIATILGKENVDKLLKHSLNAPKSVTAKSATAGKPGQPNGLKFKNKDEWDRYINSLPKEEITQDGW
jgi:hypothetical protein